MNPVFRLMTDAVQSGVFPGGVLLVAQGADIRFHGAFGLADLGSRTPVVPESVFDLASLTKPLATAAAMMVLVQDGRLGPDTRLGDRLPEICDTPKADVTLDMLLRHTSGLPAHREYFKVIAGRDDPVSLLRSLLVKEPLEYTPGSDQVYSDLGYMFLAWVIESVSGRRLDRFVRERIYDPLGIGNLFFIDLTRRNRLAGHHRLVATQDCPWRGKTLVGEVEDDNAWAAGGIDGHAGLFGNAHAVFALCREILSGLRGAPTRVLDSAVLRAFVQRRAGQDKVAGFDTPSRPVSSSGRFFSKNAVGHLGYTGTSFWIDPDTGLIVILLTNRVHPSRSNEQIRKFRPELHDCVVSTYCPTGGLPMQTP